MSVIDQDRLQRVHDAANGNANTTATEQPKPRWHHCRDLVDMIRERATEPWVPLTIGEHTIAELRPGAIALLIGATGGGKTSLAIGLAREHAQCRGPAIAVSLELSGDEHVARAIGIGAGKSWPAVLRGEVTGGGMLSALPERLAIVDRDQTDPLGACREAITALRADYPAEPILVSIDYAQLVGADSEDEIRPRIGKVMRRIDAMARECRVVVLVLSQGSRASARTLRSGEAVGATTTDAGAESADLERWASLTIAITGDAPPDDDGWYRRGLDVGKSRMGTGDVQHPARYHGASGRWDIVGDAVPAEQVRATRDTERAAKRATAAGLAIETLLTRSDEPLSATEIRRQIGGTRDVVCAAVRELVDSARIVRVGIRRGGSHLVWTRERASAVGMEIVES